MGRPGGPPGSRGAPRPRGRCSACPKEVGTTEHGNAVWHNPPGRAFPPCEGQGRPVVPNADNAPVPPIAPEEPAVPNSTHRHMALAAEAVTGGPSSERDIVIRVAQALADAEARGYIDRDSELDAPPAGALV